MAITAEARGLLEEVLGALDAPTARTGLAFPAVDEFRVAHEHQRTLIDELVDQGYIERKNEREFPPEGRYMLTRKGLLACNSETAKAAIEEFDSLLPRLKDAYRKNQDTPGASLNSPEA